MPYSLLRTYSYLFIPFILRTTPLWNTGQHLPCVGLVPGAGLRMAHIGGPASPQRLRSYRTGVGKESEAGEKVQLVACLRAGSGRVGGSGPISCQLIPSLLFHVTAVSPFSHSFSSRLKQWLGIRHTWPWIPPI